ncbi:MAG: LCP family protein [Ilumatobacteraceae bacterium]
MAGSGSHAARDRRTWGERVAIVGTIVAAVVCFLTAGGLAYGYVIVRNRDVVEISNPADRTTTPAPPPTSIAPATATPGSTSPGTGPATSPATTAVTTTTPPTFPPADPTAQNFLITGADNGACVDPSSPYAPAFGDAESGRVGERSDTIMIFRVDPAAGRVAVLSFPRDLYVTIADSGNKSRINAAYRRDEPQRLINTIYENFGVGVDHFIQVDFCTFKTLVDAVGGVAVPFEFPARDPNTGLNVPTTGCFTFDGDHALAYVRSRKYEYEDPPGSGNWQEDPTSDLGRISRQQDFLRRTLSSVLSKGLLNPSVAASLIGAATGGDVVTDSELSPAKLLEFAGVLKDIEPGSIPTYQIEADGKTINGAAVLEPRINGDNMQAVLAMFRGETSLAEAPEQVFETPPSDVPRTAVDGETAPSVETTAASEDATPVTAAPESGSPEENTFGIVPPRDVTC